MVCSVVKNPVHEARTDNYFVVRGPEETRFFPFASGMLVSIERAWRSARAFAATCGPDTLDFRRAPLAVYRRLELFGPWKDTPVVGMGECSDEEVSDERQ